MKKIKLTQESENSEKIRVGNAGHKAGMLGLADQVFEEISIRNTSFSFLMQGSIPCSSFAACSLKAAGESDLA